MVALPWLPARRERNLSLSRRCLIAGCYWPTMENSLHQNQHLTIKSEYLQSTNGVITDASLKRPPGRAPGIEEPPALACSQGLPGLSPEDLMGWPWA